MIKQVTFFLIYVLLGQVVRSITLDLPNSSIVSNNEWTRIQLGVIDETQSFRIFLNRVPLNWRQVRNSLYIPNSALGSNRKYPIRLTINDNLENILRATIVVEIENSNVRISDQVYDFEQEFQDEFFNEDPFRGRPQLVDVQNLDERNLELQNQVFEEATERTLEESESMVVTSGSGLQAIVDELIPDEEGMPESIQRMRDMAKTEKQNITINTIQQIFNELPSPKEVDQIILERDSFAILKTIQVVIRQENLNCFQKSTYINDFFGRIKSAIKMKQFTLSQLQLIIEGAQDQIQRLQVEIAFSRSQIERIDVSSLQQLMVIELNLLEQAYDDFNENFQELEAQQLSLEEVQLQMQQLQQNAQNTRIQIEQKQTQLIEKINQIQNLEQELIAARRTRDDIENNITQMVRQLRSFQFQMGQVQRRIQRIQFTITQLKDRSDRLKNSYINLQITVQRIRDDIKRSLARETELFNLIREYQMSKRDEEGKIALRQLKMLEDFIQVLTNSTVNINQEVNKIYYECFGAVVEPRTLNQQIVYSITTASFQSYLSNVYGIQLQISLTSNIILTPFYILDDRWVEAFGESYEEQQVMISDQFSFNNDFNCLNPSSLRNGTGVIVSILKNIILVEMQGDMEATLKLSPCSRVESVTQLPSVGQTILWKGIQKEDNEIQVYISTVL